MKRHIKKVSVSTIFLFSLFILGILVFTFIGGVSIRSFMRNKTWNEYVRRSQELQIGMSKDEVQRIMGQPTDKAANNRFEKESWDAFFYRVSDDGVSTHDRQIYIEFDPQFVRLVEVRPFSKLPFDAEDWKKSTPYRRWCMVDALVESKELTNISKEDAVDMLGEPTTKTEAVWEYDAGPEKGLGVDSQIMVIEFFGGRASKVFLRTD